MASSIPHSSLTYQIIGAAMNVHNRLGPGHKEAVYQDALSQALLDANFSVTEEQALEIRDGEQFLGLLYLDHLVEDTIIVEAKAFSHLLTDEEIAQVITYLAATGLSVGLLLNFGRRRLEYKRILPPQKLEGWQDRIGRYLWTPPRP